MRRRTGVGRRGAVLFVLLVAAFAALGPAAAPASAVKFTFIGDSKAAGIEYSPPAKRLLARGHTVRRDLRVCRRLVAPSCPYQGRTPATALQAIRNYGRTLGPVLVIDVGYNDSSATYRGQLEQVVRAAKVRGVKGIVWVNLRAVPAHPDYRRINAIINQVASRRPIIYVANWNAYTRGRPASWFGSDGIHLTSAGAVGLVRLVRQYVPRAAEGPRDTAALPLAPADVRHRGGRAHRDRRRTTRRRPESAAAAHREQPARRPEPRRPDGGSGNLGGFLVFAGGAALMLFLIFVTVKRRSAPSDLLRATARAGVRLAQDLRRRRSRPRDPPAVDVLPARRPRAGLRAAGR